MVKAVFSPENKTLYVFIQPDQISGKDEDGDDIVTDTNYFGENDEVRHDLDNDGYVYGVAFEDVEFVVGSKEEIQKEAQEQS